MHVYVICSTLSGVLQTILVCWLFADSFGISPLRQVLIGDNFGILALFQMLIADSFGISPLLQVLIGDNFGILALFQLVVEDNFGILNTLWKNKHHPGLESMTSGINSRYSTNCATNK